MTADVKRVDVLAVLRKHANAAAAFGERTPSARELRATTEAFEGLTATLAAIATALDAPRDRLGRIETTTAQSDALRSLRLRYGTGPCRDNIDGSVHVARAALAACGVKS